MMKTRIETTFDLSDNDRLSRLPRDILMLIMSCFTTKEAARTSLLSHEWKNLWHYFPVLTFEDPKAMRKIRAHDKNLHDERSRFVRRVNQVVEQHLGATIDDFGVTFDFDNNYHSHIDQWLAFAFAKQVKRLELDFEQVNSRAESWDNSYSFPVSCCKEFDLHHNLASNTPALTSLCLKFVNVTDEIVQCFLRSFPFLEKLSIKFSQILTTISGLSPSLKHLEVGYCWDLKVIDLSVPKLFSFGYEGHNIELHIRNASSLSRVSFGSPYRGYPISYAVDSLSKYFSQLEYLKLLMKLSIDELKFGINPCKALVNLKHLELCVTATSVDSLLQWTPWFEASPGLQKLTLQYDCVLYEKQKLNRLSQRELMNNKCLLKCLKTLEIIGFVGYACDKELTAYVLKNAVVLEEVIIDVRHPFFEQSKFGVNKRRFQKQMIKRSMEYVMELEEKLPPGVKRIIRQP